MHDLIPLPHSCALTTELAAELDSAADYAAASLSESTRRAYARTPSCGAVLLICRAMRRHRRQHNAAE